MGARLANGFISLLVFVVASAGVTVKAANPPVLELSAELAADTLVVPGQRVRLLLTVATPRWFTSGTRIRLPEVPGLVLLQNQEFAANATEQRGTDSWTLQRWSIDVFATRPGTLRIPGVDVTASVSITPGVSQTLTRTTEPLDLDVQIPSELAELEHWIASPNVTVQDTMVPAGPRPVGSALTRRVRIEAQDVMAMMLPAIDTAYPHELQAYAAPPLLKSQASRGALSAQRVETTTLIATEAADVTLDGIRIYWWNTATQRLSTLTTDDHEITIAGASTTRQLNMLRSFEIALTGLLLLMGVLLCRALPLKRWRQRLSQWLAKGGEQLKRRRHVLVASPLPKQLNPGGSPAGPSAKTQR